MLQCACVDLTYWTAAVGNFLRATSFILDPQLSRVKKKKSVWVTLSSPPWSVPGHYMCKVRLSCHTAVMKLWHFDESSVSACWYSVYDTVPSPVCCLLALSLNLSKRFGDGAKLRECAATTDRKIVQLKKEILAYVTHSTPFNQEGNFQYFSWI